MHHETQELLLTGRRQFLKGLGGGLLALPLLPSLWPRGASAQVLSRPKNFVSMITGHGGVWFENMFPSDAMLSESASYAGRNPSDSTGITQAATDAGVPSGTVITSYCDGACTTAGGVGWMTVTATQTFTPITTGFLSDFIGIGPISLSASSTMRAMT